MVDQTQNDTKTIAAAPAKIADAVSVNVSAAADTAAKVGKALTKDAGTRNASTTARKTARKAKRSRTATARRAKSSAAPKTAKRRTAARRTNTAARKIADAANERIESMTKTNKYFDGFTAFPAFAPFQSMFAQAGDRGQDIAGKGHKVAEELADLTRANVEAIVEAGRVAAEGARSLGQNMVATGRDGVEQASDAIRSLAEAKSPTEYMQLQAEFARASFDRMVAEGSKLTESMVKLAGEAFQPLQNRASANADRFNTLVA